MSTVLLLRMQSVTFDPKPKVKELTSRKRTKRMRAEVRRLVISEIFLYTVMRCHLLRNIEGVVGFLVCL